MGASGSQLQGSRADKQGFVAVAAADIDGDGQLDILTIDENSNIVITQDDLV